MADKSSLEQAVLAVVGDAGYKPVKPRGIAKRLGLDEEDAKQLKRVVKRLVKRGELRFGANHLVYPPGTGGKDNYRITGIFRRAEAGYGFVRPAGSAPGADRRHDIYIAAKEAGDASSGDTVLVRLKAGRGSTRPNPEGEIIEVIERGTRQFVGTYFESAGMAYVQVDGKPFTRPILVGDPGAKAARPDDKVVIEMVRFPSHYQDGEGVITEVLGPRGTAGVDTLSIIREFNLPEAFAEDALDEARVQAERFDESIPPERSDLTGEVVITIDPVDARDFDDAISLVRDEKGHWRLGVHIADVSHFIQPRTALDREAMQRGTSVYLPDRVLPMLPELISNGLASLQPDRVRYTKTVFIEFSPEGIPVGVEPHIGAIRSRRRFTYEEVDEFLADRSSWRTKLAPEVFALLERMHELAMMLRARRLKRGALELTMREVKIDLDREGQVAGAHLVQNTESHQIIEEFMLAANEAVAGLLHEKELHFLRRVHQAPDPRKLKALTEFVESLGLATESLESRFELQRLLYAIAGQPAEHAVNYAVLRSLQRAIYSPQEEGHYALASDCYCHFTSPIRRYPDLTIHRLLEAVLLGKKPRNDFGELAVLGEHCSDRERRAEAAERELTKVKLLNYMAGRIGEEFDGVVTGVEEFGLFVQGIQLPAEGLVHVASLQDDYYRYDRASHTLAGHRAGNRYRLGDKVRVVVARVDVDRRELDLRIVARGGAAVRSASGERLSTRRITGRNGKPTKGHGKGGPGKGGPGKGKAKKNKRGRPKR
ncbi:MAG TPA: ribonuclease R [Pirellulales bacterium]|nr:ribonuclease R [Pirellulales bacterium]